MKIWKIYYSVSVHSSVLWLGNSQNRQRGTPCKERDAMFVHHCYILEVVQRCGMDVLSEFYVFTLITKSNLLKITTNQYFNYRVANSLIQGQPLLSIKSSINEQNFLKSILPNARFLCFIITVHCVKPWFRVCTVFKITMLARHRALIAIKTAYSGPIQGAESSYFKFIFV